MHHRRRSRRRDKRIMAPCGCCEVFGPASKHGPQIDESEICMGKDKKVKPKPKKERCPVNRTHEWYKEEVTEMYEYTWWDLPAQERVYDKRTCIHCWKVIKKPRYPRYVSEWRKLKLPKRPVKEIYNSPPGV